MASSPTAPPIVTVSPAPQTSLQSHAGPNPHSAVHDEPDEQHCCRICFESEETPENPLISPCKCTGSMRYIHRSCLDEWRVNSFNPKALVGCTTCHSPFRTRYEGADEDLKQDPENRRWWLRFAKDVAWFAGVRFFAFLVTVVTLGFWPQLLLGRAAGREMMHPNPVVSHLLCGSATTFALTGTVVVAQLPGLWHTGEGLRLIFDVWCPRRGGKGSGVEAMIVILIIVGLLCCLYLLCQGIWRLFSEGRDEVMRAVRGANQKLRRQVVRDFVVLNYCTDVELPQDVVAEEQGSVQCVSIVD